jgi:class 3 adenylate cyclase
MENSRIIRKSVAVVDLAGYSSMARLLEEGTSASSVAELNRKIQSLVDVALEKASGKREQNVMHTTGDGAILLFDSAEQAHRFGVHLHEAAQEHNQGKSVAAMQLWFRVGVATGELSVHEMDGRLEYAGTTIANAVRLEAACGAGEILVDEQTWSALDGERKLTYGTQEQVAGKREERFQARRCRVLEKAPAIVTPVSGMAERFRGAGFDDRLEILNLMNRVEDEGDMEKLIYLIDMPANKRPSAQANLNKRQAEILNWARSNGGCGLEELRRSLQVVLGIQAAVLGVGDGAGR